MKTRQLWKLPFNSLNKLVIFTLEGTIDEERGFLRRIILLKHIESAVPPVQCGEKPLARQSLALSYSAGVGSEKAIPPSSSCFLHIKIGTFGKPELIIRPLLRSLRLLSPSA